MFPKSIRWRLQVWQGFLLAFVLGGFGVTAYQLHRTNELRRVDDDLARRLSALSADVRGLPPPPFPGAGIEPRRDGAPFEPGREGPPPRSRGPEFRSGPRGRPEGFAENREIRLAPMTSRLFEPAADNAHYFAVWSRGGSPLLRATNAPPDLRLPARSGPPLRLENRTRGPLREVFQFTEIGECVLVGRSIAADLAGWRRFAWLLAACGGAVLALGLGGGWWLTHRALRPVEDISVAASRIADGNLAERINIAETDSELGRLAGVLNGTFTRLETAFAQQRQFTADASHELRTPLAVLISEAQTTLARERSAAEYRETVEANLEVAQQMRRLAESLLALARFDGGQECLVRELFRLDERVRDCAERLEPLARARGIQMRFDLAPVTVPGDGERMDQVIANLLTNAFHYNREPGEVRVVTRIENGDAVLEVTDTGIGIAPEDVPHVFERFYRADKSRARAEGRAGLGLAISQAIVGQHGGSLSVASRLGHGSAFTVRLPGAVAGDAAPLADGNDRSQPVP